ncbi:MauE/DoxX family redox-associated membrane protein [Elizabethkingia ursingii]|uniref:Methylamine utilisation protein MauE domain-containing protein n=1 Tax=Elizabethkingia ursingii TaxID=1756150 RepID=A0ABX3ND39_9FLAO|nr:MauE/DoxX family redox-associated membrane protein [Elizabethkingia ursingii]OPB94553.1 hypothetical protein BB021_18300 [Elizabethkingia ursingii]
MEARYFIYKDVNRLKSCIVLTVTIFFVVLFSYTGVSKLLDFEKFQSQIASTTSLGSYGPLLAYALIFSELLTALLLSVHRTHLIGFYTCLGLMGIFTGYIYTILDHSQIVPCTCGGILQNMNWWTHLYFNIGCIIALVIAIIWKKKENNYLKKYLTKK